MLFSETIYQSILKERPLAEMKKDVSCFVEDVLSGETVIDEDSREILDELENKKELSSHEKRMIQKIKENGSLFEKFWENESRKVGNWSNVVRVLGSYDGFNPEVFRHYYKELRKSNSTDKEKLLFDMLSLYFFLTALRQPWRATAGKGGQDYETSTFLGLAKGIEKQVYSEYTDLEGEHVYCHTSYLKLQEDSEYKVEYVKDGNIYFLIDEDMYDITFDEFDKYMEY